MPFNDAAVITAAGGYVFTGAVGTARPTPAELDTVEPSLFGAQVTEVAITGAPTGGTFTITVGGTPTAAIPYNATAAQVQAALVASATVGAGNAIVTGGPLPATSVKIAWVGALQGVSPGTVTVTPTLTGGTTPAITATVFTALNGWTPVGHTSRDDMPEFGFDGGDFEVKGTWQNAQLREVTTEQAADYLTMFLHQFDAGSFELYYGANASATPGIFGVSGGNAVANEKAVLVIIVDGATRIGFYAPKAGIRRDDSIGLPVDDFATLPIRATFLKLGANNLFEWISEDLF